MKDWMITLKNPLLEEDEDGQAEGGGAQGIVFHENDPRLDHPLTPDELRRLEEHALIHAQHVVEAKDKKLLREQAKETRGEFRQGAAQKAAARFKKHPLSAFPQFAGADLEVHPLPSDAELENANSELQNRLEMQLQHRQEHRQEASPRPSPRPSPL